MPTVQTHLVDTREAEHGIGILRALTNNRHIQNEGPDVPTVTMILPNPTDSAK